MKMVSNHRVDDWILDYVLWMEDGQMPVIVFNIESPLILHSKLSSIRISVLSVLRNLAKFASQSGTLLCSTLLCMFESILNSKMKSIFFFFRLYQVLRWDLRFNCNLFRIPTFLKFSYLIRALIFLKVVDVAMISELNPSSHCWKKWHFFLISITKKPLSLAILRGLFHNLIKFVLWKCCNWKFTFKRRRKPIFRIFYAFYRQMRQICPNRRKKIFRVTVYVCMCV